MRSTQRNLAGDVFALLMDVLKERFHLSQLAVTQH